MMLDEDLRERPERSWTETVVLFTGFNTPTSLHIRIQGGSYGGFRSGFVRAIKSPAGCVGFEPTTAGVGNQCPA